MDRRRFMKHVGLGAMLLGMKSTTTEAAYGKPKQPNILFAIADDASYPHMGAYGCTWVKTPGFDRVANEGILFTRAYTPNAKCAPSRACILTGRNTWQLEEACNHAPLFPAKFITYPEALKKHGYFTGKTGKGWAPGLPGVIDGVPRQLPGQPFDSIKTKAPTKAMASTDYAANFNAFLDAKPADEPWCFWYGGHEPHRRYEYGSGVAKGGKKPSDITKVPDFWPDNETIRNDMLDYAFEIEYFDKHLARMLKAIEERGELDNTLVVVTADNGMPFPRIKGQEYELSNHLPLAVMWGNGIKKPGRVVDDYISFIDFAPTYIEITGLDAKAAGMQPTTGRSLTDIFNSRKSGTVNPERSYVIFGKERHDIGRPNDWGYPIRGIVKNDMLYLQNFEPTRWPAGNPETGYLNCDGSPTKTEILNMRRADPSQDKYWKQSFGKRSKEEMFNVKKDPECITNLADNPEYSKTKQEMKEQLFKELKAQGDPRMMGNGKVFDEYTYTNPKVRGFYERYMSGEEMSAGWVNKTDFEKGPLD